MSKKLPDKVYYTTADFRDPADEAHYVPMDEHEDGTNVDTDRLVEVIKDDLEEKYGERPFWVLPLFSDDIGYEDKDGNGGTLITVMVDWDVDEDDVFDLDF